MHSPPLYRDRTSSANHGSHSCANDRELELDDAGTAPPAAAAAATLPAAAVAAVASLLHPDEDPSHYRSHFIFRTLVSGVGFLMDAYNLFLLSLVLVTLAQASRYAAQSHADQALLTSCVLAGSILGQLAFGVIADYLGRRRSFIATLSLLIVGAGLSAAAFEAPPLRIYHCLAITLFVLGVGIGGEYPLSATVSSEAAHASPRSRGRRIASVFSMQSFGAVLAPAVVCVLLLSLSDIDAVWRVSMALGAVPGLLLIYYRYTMKESESYTKSHGADMHHKDAHAHKWRDIKAFRRKLLGAAGSWFLFDIVFYANVSAAS